MTAITRGSAALMITTVALLGSCLKLAKAEAKTRECGDPPGYFDLRATGVSCAKAREVHRRWVNKQPGGSAEQLVRVGRFRCRGESAGETFVIRCKRARPQATVRFAGGG